MNTIIRFATVLVFLLGISWCQGQTGPKAITLPKADTNAVKPVGQAAPMVIGYKSANRYRETNTVLIGDHLIVKVSNLSVLLKQLQACTAKGKPDTLFPIELFINGMQADDIRANSVNKDEGLINFDLKRKSAALSNMHFEWLWSNVPASISVGIKGFDPIAVDHNLPKLKFKFVTYASLFFVVCMVFAMFLIFWWLVGKTNLIRISDDSSKYSLGLAQLLFWVFMIAMSFIYIWITTTEMYPITGSVLVLLTISLGTSGGSRMVDQMRGEGRAFQETSGSFFQDILSDDLGYSVHRVQMAIWTAIFGIIFIYEVVVKQQMPQFDNNLLLLMGISSTGYVGLKSIEAIKKETPAVAALPTDTEKETEPKPASEKKKKSGK